mgnify:CR=1 FL=1
MKSREEKNDEDLPNREPSSDIAFGEEKKSEEDEFTMYVMDLSYFSGKLECYFNYQVPSLSN